MGYLILWWAIGVIVRFLLSAIQQSTGSASFDFKSSAMKAGVAIIIGGIAAFFATKANMQHWIFYAVFAIGGFLTKYIIEKLTEIKG